jgi:hypothetical protein
VASTLASGIHAGKVSWQVTLNSHHILWLIEHSSVEFNKLLIQRNRDLSYNPARQPIIITPPTEAEVYARDMALLPDIPTLETHARIPIEDRDEQRVRFVSQIAQIAQITELSCRLNPTSEARAS